jgi:transcriptional regulator with XRE-family HTH domain
MKIGKNIMEIREAKGFSQEYVADELDLKLSDYICLENDDSEITLTKLNAIAQVLSCSIIYILQYKEASGSIYNHFDNNGNQGVNIKIQGIDQEEIRKAYQELYKSELDRIPKLEKLLRDNRIDFDF